MKKIFNYQSYKLMMQYISRIVFKSVSTYICFFFFCIILLIVSLLPSFFQDFQQSNILDYIFLKGMIIIAQFIYYWMDILIIIANI